LLAPNYRLARYEVIAVEVKGKDPKNTWEIVRIYRVLKEDKRFLEKLADRTAH